MDKSQIYNLLKDNLPSTVDIAEKDHGWGENNIRVRLPKCDLLVTPAIGKKVSITCMCFVSARDKMIDEIIQPEMVVDRIYSLLEHACVPWPG